jgi:hypothetical protein
MCSASGFLKSVKAQKDNDRVAVKLRHVPANFWIDVRGPEVKATGKPTGWSRDAAGNRSTLVAGMVIGVK